MTTQAYFLPRSLDEALGLLAEHGPTLLIMAGGTLTMPLINEGVSMPEKVLGLRQAGLNYVRSANSHVAIGATTRRASLMETASPPLDTLLIMPRRFLRKSFLSRHSQAEAMARPSGLPVAG